MSELGIFAEKANVKVSIYAANVKNLPTDANLYKSFIDQERLTKAEKFYQHNDKQLCLGAGLLFAWAVRASFPQAQLPLKLDYTVNKKPTFKCYENFHFNISHSGHWVICAVAAAPIGVDIEKAQRDMSDVARHYFSNKEQAYIASLPQSAQRRAFYDFWVLKESYMKATGQGFKISPADLHLELNPLPSKVACSKDFCLHESDNALAFKPLLYHSGELVDYSFRLCEFFDASYRLAFAVKGKAEQVPVYSLIQVECRALLDCFRREVTLKSELLVSLKSREKNHENISAI